MATATTTTRHGTLYFDEPETLIFEVGGILFRPHIFLLRRYSEFFQDMLSLGFEKQLEGCSDSLPIVLADVHLADWDHPEITAEEFELALSVMYPESISSAQWCKVLDVAKRWQSQLLRDTAISHLAKSDLHPSMRLMISTKYNVPEWLPDVLPELCLQRTFPPEDIVLLPPSLIVPFFSAREEFRNELVSRVSSQTKVPPSPRHFKNPYAYTLPPAAPSALVPARTCCRLVQTMVDPSSESAASPRTKKENGILPDEMPVHENSSPYMRVLAPVGHV
ncbi:hypothetical protein BS47DRAFT_1383269 [Hydnum rufescens UP504]|uniref:BTB domain-containing protein n=1 Tax=Hydnum rufescens UP504 TaxID=1448309 RepID=A0A9P6DVM8_9AGAM|nr:hypothetical protein BS47DRAFT_1383269 [Hydnum rufescens UP504]